MTATTHIQFFSGPDKLWTIITEYIRNFRNGYGKNEVTEDMRRYI